MHQPVATAGMSATCQAQLNHLIFLQACLACRSCVQLKQCHQEVQSTRVKIHDAASQKQYCSLCMITFLMCSNVHSVVHGTKSGTWPTQHSTAQACLVCNSCIPFGCCNHKRGPATLILRFKEVLQLFPWHLTQHLLQYASCSSCLLWSTRAQQVIREHLHLRSKGTRCLRLRPCILSVVSRALTNCSPYRQQHGDKARPAWYSGRCCTDCLGSVQMVNGLH